MKSEYYSGNSFLFMKSDLKRHLLIITLLLFRYLSGESQCLNLESNKELKNKTWYLVDSTGKLALEDLKNKKFQKFENSGFPKFLISEYRYAYWFKFCLVNTSLKSQEYVLTMGEVYSQEYHINSNLNKNFTILLSQDKRLGDKPYHFDHKYLKIKLKPTETLQVMVRVKDKTGQKFLLNPSLKPLAIEHEERLENLYNERFAMALNIFLNAVLFFVLMYVLVQYYFIRFKFLLYYALYLFSMMLFHLYGFSYSSFFETPLSLIPFLQFELRQNFYVIITQIFYMLFLREFFDIDNNGTKLQKNIFRYQHWILLALLFFEVVFSIIINRLDLELLLALLTQFFVICISIYLLFTMFTSKILKAPITIRLASLILFVGVIIGFLSATFEWVQTTSPILQYYPNYFFNFCVLAEVFLYSLAIGQLFYKTVAERGILNQKIALSELNTLRSQINPHFLFNSLNSIKSLIIQEKKHEAASFLTEFSSLIRNILQKSREQFLSLEEELKFTEQYLDLEKKRFDNGFEYLIQVSDGLSEKLVPAFIIQPFVENCIKHAFIDLKEKGEIKIEINENQDLINIEITDNGIGRKKSNKLKLSENLHKSLGTKLIEDRLKILNEIYGWKITFEIIDLAKGTKVVMTIPFFD